MDEHKRQTAKYYQAVQNHLDNKKQSKTIILIASLVITFIAFVISAATGFDKNVTGYSMGICLLWDVTYGLYYFQTKDDSTWDVSFEKRKEIEKNIINADLQKKTDAYNAALRKYEDSLKINKESVVQVELLAPSISGGRTVVSTIWMVFSNIHLANPRSYPDMEINFLDVQSFRAEYNALIERQKSVPPRPKKHLGIGESEKFQFYYPCSDMFSAMTGKKPGDIVSLSIGVEYRILQVFNPDDFA